MRVLLFLYLLLPSNIPRVQEGQYALEILNLLPGGANGYGPESKGASIREAGARGYCPLPFLTHMLYEPGLVTLSVVMHPHRHVDRLTGSYD